ncbi:cytochrome C biogenesis protein [Halobacillus trueperi]|uniref:Cytochrome C biogenesis protein n=1 Tax=Halobacillus trueperi TaxID=156205 RepID=A0A3E0J4M3_9BACI|nr:cytochrome C biogenesis protein [Halobacillus trueperi]REJ07955.1 cytochrome C biogenesis protein [Halobacillus trueperi]
MNFSYVKFEVLLPEEYIVPLRDQLNKNRVLTVGEYDHVVSYTETKGYWRPLESSDPYSGEKNKVAFGLECKMEFKSPYKRIEEIRNIIKSIHPYEEPVINVVPLIT